MKKELKQILFICVFLIVGCIIGYFFAIYQINQYKDPTFMALLASHNMSSSEPIGLTTVSYTHLRCHRVGYDLHIHVPDLVRYHEFVMI